MCARPVTRNQSHICNKATADETSSCVRDRVRAGRLGEENSLCSFGISSATVKSSSRPSLLRRAAALRQQSAGPAQRRNSGPRCPGSQAMGGFLFLVIRKESDDSVSCSSCRCYSERMCASPTGESLYPSLFLPLSLASGLNTGSCELLTFLHSQAEPHSEIKGKLFLL